jgi:hypothetical protein
MQQDAVEIPSKFGSEPRVVHAFAPGDHLMVGRAADALARKPRALAVDPLP